MTERVWNGAAGDWNTAGNWTPSGVPDGGDSAVISTGAATAAASIDVGAVEIDSAGTVSFVDAGALTAASIDNAGTLNIDIDFNDGGSLLSVAGTLTNSGMFQLGGVYAAAGNLASSATVAAFENSGTLSIFGATAEKSLIVDGAAGFGTAGTLTGTVLLSGDALIQFASGTISTIATGAHLRLSGGEAGIADAGGSSALAGLALNNGELDVSDGASLGITGDLTNAGSIEVDYDYGGGGSRFTVGGTLDNAAGGYLLVGDVYSTSAPTNVTLGNLTNQGEVDLVSANSTATVTVAGALVNDMTINVGAGGVLAVEGTLSGTGSLTLQSGGVLDFAGGTQTLAELQQVNNQGGTLDFTGGTLDLGGQTMDIAANGLFSAVIVDGGTIADGTILPDGGSLTWQSGTLLDVTFNGALSLGASATLAVAGTVTAASIDTAGMIELDVGFYDGGNMLSVAGTLTNAGTVQIGAIYAGAGNLASSVTVGAFDNSGTLSIFGTEAEKSLIVDGAAGFGTAGTLTGTISMSGDALIQFASGTISTIAAGAQLRLDGPEARIADAGSASGNSALAGLAVNDGELDLLNGATLGITGDYRNNGTTNVDYNDSGFTVGGNFTNASGGLLLVGDPYSTTIPTGVTFGSLTNQGEIDIVAGNATATMTATGALVNDETLKVGTGGVLVVGGTLSGTGTLTLFSGGMVDFAGSAQTLAELQQVDNRGGTLDFTAGTLDLGGQTMDIAANSVLGSVVVSGGTIADGTILPDGGSLTWQSGTLSGATVSGPLDLGASATLAVAGAVTVTGALTNDGTMSVGDGAALTVGGALSGGGAITLAGSGDATLNGTVASGQTIVVGAGVLTLGDSADFSGTISFASPDPGTTERMLDIADLTYQAGDRVDLEDGNVLKITEAGGGQITLQLDPAENFGGQYFHLSSAGPSGTTVSEDRTPCYCAGTLIATARGQRRVEALKIGDRVRTISGALRTIKWIGRRSYRQPFLGNGNDVAPVRIAAGAIADGTPARDLLVSPLHAMFIDGVLIPAGLLVNGRTIRRARDIAEVRYFHIELDSHDVIFAEGAPSETFVDCDTRAMFHNAEEFDALYPGDASPAWRFCAPRVEEGATLRRIWRRLAARAEITVIDDRGQAADGRLEGYVDVADAGGVEGWAWAPHSAAPVELEILDGDGVLARVTADRFRRDLKEKGIGDGCHYFAVPFDPPLAPWQPHRITVRRVSDGRALTGSPVTIAAARGFDLLDNASFNAALEAGLERLEPAKSGARLDEMLTLLLTQVERIRRLSATHQDGPGRDGARRALMIDDRWPVFGRDAGSNAMLGHIQALQALGYRIEFAASHGWAETPPQQLTELGVRCRCLPQASSVEGILRGAADRYDLIYLHRVENAAAYAGLARALCPKARIVFSVADLHHVRLARQGAAEQRPAVLARARAVRESELLAMRQSDVVITHSDAEAAYLHRQAPGVRVGVVGWPVPPAPAAPPLSRRSGIGFIGSYAHGPNQDAVRWLMDEIMPRVWRHQPAITCGVVGHGWPQEMFSSADRRMVLDGPVDDLTGWLQARRLIVAPLRFGAGVKGKVLDSLAAGIPCAVTTIAAEGIALRGAARSCVADTAEALAEKILRLHGDPALNQEAGQAGREMVREGWTLERVTQDLAAALSAGPGDAGGEIPAGIRHSSA